MKALLEQRAKLAAEIRKHADLANDPKHEWTSEDEANWLTLNRDYDTICAKVEKLERAAKVQKDIETRETERPPHRLQKDLDEDGEEEGRREDRSQGPTAEDQALALQAWCRYQRGDELTPDQERACRKTGKNPRREHFDIPLTLNYRGLQRQYEKRAPMGTGAGIGGDTIPAGFVPNFERALLDFCEMRKFCDVIRTPTGNVLTWPFSNDTGNVGALLAENTQDAEVDVTTGHVHLEAYKYTSKIVLVSAELLEDSAFDLAATLGSMLGERIARAEAVAFTTGDGSAKPHGLVIAATAGPATAVYTAITGDEIKDLYHSVDPAYREDPSAAFMCHDTILAYIRKIKAGTDLLYLWDANFASGMPNTLLGKPVITNAAMESTFAVSHNLITFGPMRYYKIRDVAGVRLKRMVERYADYDQEGFVAFHRTDGELLDAGTHPIKVLTAHPD